MRTIKLVVIGASGVGKTSLRGQYISGRFSTGYRATIGADFISKTLPDPTNPDEYVTLQIWDTAGQERFSSLSSAFFRGADAAILMFDVNSQDTMLALHKWWDEFKTHAPLTEENMADYCCVVVGNKMDLPSESDEGRVHETDAKKFLQELIPMAEDHSNNELQRIPSLTHEFSSLSRKLSSPPSPRIRSNSIPIMPGQDKSTSPKITRQMSTSSLTRSPSSVSRSFRPESQSRGKSRSRSSGSMRFYAGTMTTTHTSLTIYHTPSSSIFDVYASARTSPEPWSSESRSASPLSEFTRRKHTRTRSRSNASESTDALTITPSMFYATANSHSLSRSYSNPSTPPAPLPPSPLRGPKLFFTSAKTGSGVNDVFEYIASRVVKRWEWEEGVEARRMSMREEEEDGSGSDVVRLGLSGERGRQRRHGSSRIFGRGWNSRESGECERTGCCRT